VSSSIRNIRDTRNSSRTYRDTRGATTEQPVQKTYDANFTEHNSNVSIPADHGHPSRTDISVDRVHEVVRDQLVPAIQTLSANAVLVDRREFYLYKRRRTGRRCSCFANETSPDASCQVCLGVGIVGGYDKFGTHTEVLDFTHPSLRLVNVEPNLEDDTRPVYLRLKPGFSKGFAEVDFSLKQNIKEIDTYNLFQPLRTQGTKIFAIDPDGFDKEIQASEDFNHFLKFPKITIRVVFNAVAGLSQKYYFSHFVMRYKTQENLLVFGDIPKTDYSLTLSNLGVFDQYNEMQIFFDGKSVRSFDNEDILYRLYDGRRVKIIQVTPNIVANILTSLDVQARFIVPGLDIGPINLLI
jgi:hypothetical protein